MYAIRVDAPTEFKGAMVWVDNAVALRYPLLLTTDAVGPVAGDGPGVGGRSALIASRILGFHRKAMVALRQVGVADRARTGIKSPAVQLAEKAHAALGVGEAEGGRGLAGRVGWGREDGWTGRKRRTSRWPHAHDSRLPSDGSAVLKLAGVRTGGRCRLRFGP